MEPEKCRLHQFSWLLQYGSRFLRPAPSRPIARPLRILTRYIAFDLLKVFLLTLTVMTAFMFVVLTAKLAVEEGLGLVPIIRTLPFMLPQAMQYTVPGTMLLATVTVYGRVAAFNEMVAVKSMGISPMVMIWPTFALATLISFGAVVLNDVAVSWGRGGVERVLLDSFEDIIYGRLRTTKSYSDNSLEVHVNRVQDEWLVEPTVTYAKGAGGDNVFGRAQRAKIKFDAEQRVLMLTCLNAEIEGNDNFSGYHPGWFDWPISVEEIGGRSEKKRKPSQYALREIGPSKIEQTAMIQRLEQEMSAEVGHALMTGRTYELEQAAWQSKEFELRRAVGHMHRLNTEPHRRWASGFSCLCFVMIGAPMAIRLRHGEIWGSFFACFLPILLVYYPMLAGCLDAAKDGVLPPQAVWLGNVVLAIWGTWLVRRVIKF